MEQGTGNNDGQADASGEPAAAAEANLLPSSASMPAVPSSEPEAPAATPETPAAAPRPPRFQTPFVVGGTVILALIAIAAMLGLGRSDDDDEDTAAGREPRDACAVLREGVGGITDQQCQAVRQALNPNTANDTVPAVLLFAAEAQLAQLDPDPRLPGVYVPPYAGVDGVLCSARACLSTQDDRGHVGNQTVPICTEDQLARKDVALCYSSNPPTSGLHAGQPAPFSVLPAPATKEALVHNMEHGGVVVWHNTTNAQFLGQLTAIVNAALSQRKQVVMSAYAGMEPDTIALTAWTRLDKFPAAQFNPQRVLDFIAAHDRRFNPEGF